MSDITNNELRRIDLTLLLVFLGLLRHRKATEVAAELGLTQSGISQALKRLRDIFADDLFLRRPHGLEPTAIALSLEVPIAAAVEALRSTLGSREQFSPASATGVIRLAALDAEQANLVPGLVRHFSEHSPQLQLMVLPLARREAMLALHDNDVDLAVGFFWDVAPNLISVPLYTQNFVVVGKADVLGKGSLTLERYAGLPHILVSPSGGLRGIADEALERRGFKRKVVATVPQFFPALATVAATKCIATLPRGLAMRYAVRLGLAVKEPPLEIRSFTITAMRHKRNEFDQRLLWVMKVIVESPT